MRYSLVLAALATVAVAAGCDDESRTLVRTAAPTATATAPTQPTTTSTATVTATVAGSPAQTAVATGTLSATPTTPLATVSATVTPTATQVGTAPGPIITYFGITTADDRPIESSGTDGAGRPVFERELGTGLNLVIEAQSGLDGRPVGTQAFEAAGLPDLQLLVSRPLGDGSALVCDVDPSAPIGGVPAVDPPVFSNAEATVDAINDLGCRVNDGAGLPLARTSRDQACTRFATGDFTFVDPSSQAQFCLPIARAWAFPQGDTIVTARVRSVLGSIGNPQQIVVRIERALTPLPTLPLQTPLPTPTPVPPQITYFGLAAADDAMVAPSGVDDDGRDVYSRLIGHAFSLVVEAAPGADGRPVGPNAFFTDGLPPDLQLLVSRDLGDGNPEVCDVDIDNQIFGGVPGFEMAEFDDAPARIDAMNDLGCRVNDGTGAPLGRTLLSPCTRDRFGNFTFVDPRSTIQFCLPIARAWQYQAGDTVTAARVRGVDGGLSAVEEIVVRVEGDGREDCEVGGPGARVFSVAATSSIEVAGIDGQLSTQWVAEPALLCAGADEGGVHPLRLLADFRVGMQISGGSVLCMAFSADASEGFLDCAGTEPAGVRYELDAATERTDLTTGLGASPGPGSALLSLPVAFRTLPDGASLGDCFTAAMPSPSSLTLTTGTAEAEVLHAQQGGVVAIAIDGAPFDCDRWRSEGSGGAFALPVASTDTAIGDAASVFVLDD